MSNSRAKVLDGNHGIEIIDYGLSGKEFLPWYYNKTTLHQHYYTWNEGGPGVNRVTYNTWIEAFDHIAHSRRMLTHDMAGSNYLQEARDAGVELPETVQPKQVAMAELTTNDDEGDVEYTVVVHKHDDSWHRELSTYSYNQAQAKFDLIAEQPGEGEKEVAILADGEMDTFLTLHERDVPTTGTPDVEPTAEDPKQLTTEDLMPEEQAREALASWTPAEIERAYHAGDLSDMDVFHLLNGNPTTGEE